MSAVRAVLFDVDGTLYHQAPLRLCMAAELAALPLRSSMRSARRTSRAIRAFRRAQEELRELGAADASLARLQLERAAERAGMEAGEVEAAAAEWIFRRPLPHLRRCRRGGIERLLQFLKARGMPAGVFSDYPALPKLEVLGLAENVSLVACATDTEINAFKPDPRGFLWSCKRWGIEPAQVLYVGDRVEVDARGAANAGMPCAILSRRLGLTSGGVAPLHVFESNLDSSSSPNPESLSYSRFSSFAGLQHAIDAGG
jgi:putative hydrolase of the HAD superfamily